MSEIAVIHPKSSSRIGEPIKADAERLLLGGLSSTRAGFSVEEMEAERAKKKTKSM